MYPPQAIGNRPCMPPSTQRTSHPYLAYAPPSAERSALPSTLSAVPSALPSPACLSLQALLQSSQISLPAGGAFLDFAWDGV
jgi:hypothetical protein